MKKIRYRVLLHTDKFAIDIVKEKIGIPKKAKQISVETVNNCRMNSKEAKEYENRLNSYR